MDIVLQVFTNASTHDLPAEKHARRSVNEDIFFAMLASDVGTREGDIYTPNDSVGMTNMSFIFIIDTSIVDIENVNLVLVEDALNQGGPVETTVKRNWALNLSGLDLSQKHATITFNEFYARCHDKLNPGKTIEDMGVI